MSELRDWLSEQQLLEECPFLGSLSPDQKPTAAKLRLARLRKDGAENGFAQCFAKIGGRIAYDRQAVLQWLESAKKIQSDKPPKAGPRIKAIPTGPAHDVVPLRMPNPPACP